MTRSLLDHTKVKVKNLIAIEPAYGFQRSIGFPAIEYSDERLGLEPSASKGHGSVLAAEAKTGPYEEFHLFGSTKEDREKEIQQLSENYPFVIRRNYYGGGSRLCDTFKSDEDERLIIMDGTVYDWQTMDMAERLFDVEKKEWDDGQSH